MSLRWRIALGLGLIAALVVLFGATAAYVTTSQRLSSSLDESLRTTAERLPGVQQPDRTSGPDHDQPSGDGNFSRPQGCPPTGDLAPAVAAQRIAADGTVTACIDGQATMPVDRHDREIAAGQGSRIRTVQVNGTNYRVFTVSSSGGAYQLARPLNENQDVLSSLRLRLAVIGATGVLTAMGLGWLLARRIVKPIERLELAADHIAVSQDLNSDVPVDGPAEIGSLGRSFTTMVRALAASRRAQQDLVRDASHELRTPLTSLRTNSELLGRADELTSDEYAAVVTGIQLETQELADLVAELVDLATDEPQEVLDQDLHLGAVAEAVAATAARRTTREIRVELVGAAGTDLVRASPQLLDRTLANIVDNAAKYSTDGMPIDIVVQGTRVEVRDRGPGIAPADLARVFDRFYRAPAAQELPGSGLGLAIVAQTVARYGGTTFAHNNDGPGATVGFELPAVCA
jgi:two-component system sensor histidine kinase MprB